MGTLCCSRRQEATTATAAASAARIDWPPAAAGWPAPLSRDALENQRDIKRTPRKRTTTPTAISRLASGDLLPYAIHIKYAGARAHRARGYGQARATDDTKDRTVYTIAVEFSATLVYQIV